jgi:hypothetical protein
VVPFVSSPATCPLSFEAAREQPSPHLHDPHHPQPEAVSRGDPIRLAPRATPAQTLEFPVGAGASSSPCAHQHIPSRDRVVAALPAPATRATRGPPLVGAEGRGWVLSIFEAEHRWRPVTRAVDPWTWTHAALARASTRRSLHQPWDACSARAAGRGFASPVRIAPPRRGRTRASRPRRARARWSRRASRDH